MAQRQLSSFAARGPHPWEPNDLEGAIGALPELTAAQRAWFTELILPSGRGPEPCDFEVIEGLRAKFFRVRERQLSAASYRATQRRLTDWVKWTARGEELLDRDLLTDELALERLAAKAGRRPGAIRALLPFMRELARASADVKRMHRPRLDPLTPFNGLVAEAAHYFRNYLAIEPTASAVPSLFVRWLFAFMQTLPKDDRLHVGGIKTGPLDGDSWGGLVKAAERALRVTAQLQNDGQTGRNSAWWMGPKPKR